VNPLALSLLVALPATALAAVIGVSAAAVTNRLRGWWQPVLDAVFTAPLVFPPTVLGYVLLTGLGRQSGVGRLWESLFGSPLVFSRAGAVVAATVTALPLVVQSSRAALVAVDERLLQAAATLGASPWKTWWLVHLPLASRGLAAGIALGFARALGEFGVTLMIAGNLPGLTQTASLALYEAVASGEPQVAQSLAWQLSSVALATIVAALALARRPHA
jgi:molybdate transport system permease protein